MNRFSFAAALVAMLVAGGAPAADPKLQGVGEAGLGYLDTVQSAPDGAPGSVSTRGVVVLLSPGLLLAFSSPRTLQRVGYRYQHDFFLASTTTSSSTNRLEYLGFFDLSPRVALLLDANHRVPKTRLLHCSFLTHARKHHRHPIQNKLASFRLTRYVLHPYLDQPLLR
jgi:hypothetical protein